MSGHATGTRLHRLDELKGLLKARDHVTTAELAASLGVSLRTLNRDLQLLRESGVPVESARGRGGGVRMHRNWALGRLHLTSEEAIDLLLSIAIAEQINSPLLLRELAGVKRKIVAAFSNAHQSRIRSLRTRILVGKPASPQVVASFVRPPRKALSGITEAFFNMRCVSIDYAGRSGAITSRVVEPQFLYLSLPVWYLLAWDQLRVGVRYFRIDRIRSVTLLERTFQLADPRPFLAQAEKGIEAL